MEQKQRTKSRHAPRIRVQGPDRRADAAGKHDRRGGNVNPPPARFRLRERAADKRPQHYRGALGRLL